MTRPLAIAGPALLDVESNAEEVAVPPKPGLEQARGFAVAMLKEGVVSREAG